MWTRTRSYFNKISLRTALSIALLLPATASSSFAADASPAPTAPSPMPVASPAAAPIATPVPPITYTDRLLDLSHGYIFFSNGDAYQLEKNAILADAQTHSALNGDDVTARYGLAFFASDGKVVKLDVSDKPFAAQPLQNEAHQFAIVASAQKPNPDLADHHDGFTGEPVLVVFTVEVPPTTGFNDSIFLSTEASGWDAMAMKMDRIDALHFRITRTLASGTHFVYRYTRGTWRSAERQENGLEGAPRKYVVQNLDVARRKDTVYHWSDENPSGGNLPGPNAVPTPQTGRPFQFSQ